MISITNYEELYEKKKIFLSMDLCRLSGGHGPDRRMQQLVCCRE